MTASDSIASFERVSFGDVDTDTIATADDPSFLDSTVAAPVHLPEPVLLSTPSKCTVEADTPGNLGPPEVVLIGGHDWGKDRWATHGKDWDSKVPSECHWIMLTWLVPVFISHISLDWETAFAWLYAWQIRKSPAHHWETVVESPNPNIETVSVGLSPGGDYPLHHLHEMDVPFSKWTTSLRLLIHESAFKNGFVSMWNIKVFGYESSPVGEETAPFFLQSPPMLLTGLSDFVSVSASDPGERDLSIENVLHEGTDFGKDRWLILRSKVCGGAWVQMDFTESVLICKLALDWSGDIPKYFEVQVGSLDNWQTYKVSNEDGGRGKELLETSMVDGCMHDVQVIPLPLHQPTRAWRLWIPEGAVEDDSNVSLWQIRVYGYKMSSASAS